MSIELHLSEYINKYQSEINNATPLDRITFACGLMVLFSICMAAFGLWNRYECGRWDSYNQPLVVFGVMGIALSICFLLTAYGVLVIT